MAEKLSLFPLNTLLVPDATLELQIFEQRYLRLIKDCIRDQCEFGIVPIRDGHEVGQPAMIFQVGVTAQITEWDQNEKGLLLIKVQGRRKFRVLQTGIDADQLMQAEVEYLAEEPETAIPNRYDELLALYEKLIQHPGVEQLNLPHAQNARQLGWFLTFLLPISRPDQIQLLGMDDPLKRLETLNTLL